MICQNCHHRLSANIDNDGRVIAGYHHKHGHGMLKRKNKGGVREWRDPHCECKVAKLENIDEIK